MTNSSVKVKNSTEDIDPLEQYLNELCFCMKQNGKSFVAKLIKIHGDELYFQTSTGKIVMNRRQSLTQIRVFDPETEAV